MHVSVGAATESVSDVPGPSGHPTEVGAQYCSDMLSYDDVIHQRHWHGSKNHHTGSPLKHFSVLETVF